MLIIWYILIGIYIENFNILIENHSSILKNILSQIYETFEKYTVTNTENDKLVYTD